MPWIVDFENKISWFFFGFFKKNFEDYLVIKKTIQDILAMNNGFLRHNFQDVLAIKREMWEIKFARLLSHESRIFKKNFRTSLQWTLDFLNKISSNFLPRSNISGTSWIELWILKTKFPGRSCHELWVFKTKLSGLSCHEQKFPGLPWNKSWISKTKFPGLSCYESWIWKKNSSTFLLWIVDFKIKISRI